MISRARLLACTSFVCLCVPASAQRPREEQVRVLSAQAPLQASLLAALDAGRLIRGAPVYAKAFVDWNTASCHLRAGSIVSGHIVALQQRSKQSQGSSLAIAFDHAECSGLNTPFSFTLFAIIADPSLDEGAPLVSNAANFGFSGAGGIDTDRFDRRAGHHAPATVQSGQVFGMKKVKLEVGAGPDGASILSSPKGNIRLEGATQLILVPRAAIVPARPPEVAESPAPPHPAASLPTAPAPAKSEPPPPPPPEVDETSVCTASCSTVPELTAPAHASLALSASIFGYVPHDRREYAAFDFESTLHFLDANNLLFTYDPHHLRHRSPIGFDTESTRSIRAVLLDPATLKVKRILDWQILDGSQGEGQYLWRAGPEEILLHLGHTLRLLSPNLTALREIPLPGQLVFLATSPSGDHIAVGMLHERHTRAMHDELAGNLRIQPEEDIDVQILDRNLKVLFTSRQSSALPVPVLSDAGEVRLHSSGEGRWLIREYRWDGTVHTIAKLLSECRPNLSTPLQNAIFVVGCNASNSRNWYRMIRLDGHPVLTSQGTSEDIEQSSSSSNQTEFAVRVVRANNRVSRGDLFFKQDLKEQEVSVYRAAGGKRLFSATSPGVSLAQQSFALSPTGAQLAVLSGVTISLYPIPPAAP